MKVLFVVIYYLVSVVLQVQRSHCCSVVFYISIQSFIPVIGGGAPCEAKVSWLSMSRTWRGNRTQHSNFLRLKSSQLGFLRPPSRKSLEELLRTGQLGVPPQLQASPGTTATRRYDKILPDRLKIPIPQISMWQVSLNYLKIRSGN